MEFDLREFEEHIGKDGLPEDGKGEDDGEHQQSCDN